MISVYLLYHFGQFTNFKQFYLHYVCKHLDDLFPDLISHERFNARQERILLPLMLYLKNKGFFGFKLHLIINNKGELLPFYLTKGNVDDRNIELMTARLKISFESYLVIKCISLKHFQNFCSRWHTTHY